MSATVPPRHRPAATNASELDVSERAPQRVSIITLGCGRNEVDSDQLAGLFHRDGAVIVDDPQAADVVLVNTCTFIAPAKQESVDTVLEACQLKDDGVARAVLVVGCMAQRYPDELAEAIPEADAIVGFDGYGRLPAIVAEVLSGQATERVIGVGAAHPGSRPSGRELPLMIAPDAPGRVAAQPDPEGRHAADGASRHAADGAGRSPTVSRSGVPTDAVADGGGRQRLLGLDVIERPRDDVEVAASQQDQLDRMPASGPRFPLRHLGVGGPRMPWSYLKIASGCDRVCTFCAIPSFRGRFRSRPLDEIVAEAAWLGEQGVRELVLVSENTTSWGKDLPGGRGAQVKLLEQLGELDDIERIRLMYLQPAELTAPLLDAMTSLPKVASYFDLSLQHVSGPVVSAMARSGDHERFGALIERCRALDPDAVFRSNFILGFPGETDEDVDRLEAFLLEHRLDWVGLFPFSREDGTPSDTLPDQVPEQVAHERVRRIADVQERLADESARSFVGRDLEVLVDGHDDTTGQLLTVGRSYREAPDTDGEVELVAPDGSPAELPAGRIVTARVIDAVGVDLIAEVDAEHAGDGLRDGLTRG